ncbi:Ltp family lipoprotein [Cellulosimicrobium sp. TH-20]|uniref:Ltp family lipoprotein n=1 Tax=Cellulosimicrobium sp. TH-20 TaxID=1980001 RepID=UPI00210757E2|nr:Ltp family lipoprotein [Cellulosimicrobium sp. TH-20]
MVLLIVVIAALVGGNGDPGEEPVVVATTQVADQGEKSADEIAADEQAEAERLAEEEAAAAAQAEEERLAEEQRLADEAAAAEAAAAEAARIGSVAQQNAYRSAVSYLDLTGFSRSGLIGQLEFEGFSTADAEFAIARLEAEGGVDWNAEAAESAASYLDLTSFSRAGLVDQLLFEGFTPEQAEYGVSTTGL